MATVGLNMDQSVNQLKTGQLSYSLNSNVENFDGLAINYGNEEGNEICLTFPEGYLLIGKHFISERSKHIFFLASEDGANSEIGYMDNNDCEYHTLVNAPCLNFNTNNPIHKVAHKINNCGTEIYWTDGLNPRRYLDIDNPPRVLKLGSNLVCNPEYEDELDCNQLKIQPNFSIPSIQVGDVVTGGNLISGTYQFAIQYCDATGNAYTSYYSVTNPTPIFDDSIVSINFNFPVGKSIVVSIDNLDDTGQFQYFNLAVIKTINGVTSVELAGTYFIDNTDKTITYTGQSQTDVRLSINDIFEKQPYYEIAQDLTVVQDVLVWDNLTSIDRMNYQSIASQIHLQWETWRIPATENYADEINAANLRGYLRDEIYPFEIVFLLQNGKQTDGFHIPGRASTPADLLAVTKAGNDDFILEDATAPYWKIYNTASITGTSPDYSPDSSYKGPYQYGEFAYWESEETYPCNTTLWGNLAGQKIRHHKFPDVEVSPIHEAKTFSGLNNLQMGDNAIYPIGVKIDPLALITIINSSSLTQTQKDEIVGYKIVRGDRTNTKSIVGKGILRNVGKYEREDQEYLYPNYPYNDLTEDPFLNSNNNAYADVCNTYGITISDFGGGSYAEVKYTDCNTNKPAIKQINVLTHVELCSTTKPIIQAPAIGTLGLETYEIWRVKNVAPLSGWTCSWDDPSAGKVQYTLCSTTDVCPLGTYDFYINAVTVNVLKREYEIHIVPNTGGPVKIDGGADAYIHYVGLHTATTDCSVETPVTPIIDHTDLKDRQVFNSPETSFGQPFLGTVLKLENVMYGKGISHFTEVKNNAKYRLITEEAQRRALESSQDMTSAPFDATAMFTAYQAYLQIYLNGIAKKNYAYSFNSIADYAYTASVPNNLGIKQRNIDVARYLIPGVQAIDGDKINNYQRESSVYTKVNTSLPFPDENPNIQTLGVTDRSRHTISSIDYCSTPTRDKDITVSAYYASLKNEIVNLWGQIYSYDTVDTGYQYIYDAPTNPTTIFGGDTFIGKFAFKTKLPFFIDNRVGAPDDSDIYYDEIGNIAYPKYWHSARSILKDYSVGGVGTLSGIISYKAHNFDCPNLEDVEETSGTTTTTTTLVAPNPEDIVSFYDGYFYLFAYGVPSFYCESSYNLDLRQAYNNREGEFWPHVSSDIPDDWVQESFVSIANDNTYYYNSTFSKQNRENTFTHLPFDWDSECYKTYPFRAIYSDNQYTGTDNKINNWLVYKPLSYFDFPQNYGELVSLDGIQNKAILARFENKTLLYNNLLTLDTSNPQMAYLGNPRLFDNNPPIDFADTDLGYIGSQHKMLLKIPQGQITADAKRGQVFLIRGTEVIDLTAFGSGVNRFFTDHLAFEILRYFPDVPIDNAYTGIGLHGVYDSKYDRVIITKLDYIPIRDNITYNAEEGKFYINDCTIQGVAIEVEDNEIPTYTDNASATLKKQVYLDDPEYFCNKSWTISYNLNTNSWISFHSYTPNYYIGENNFFYSGVNSCCADFDFIVGVAEDTCEIVGTCTKKPSTSPDCEFGVEITITTPLPSSPDCEFEVTVTVEEPQQLDCEFETQFTIIETPSTDCEFEVELTYIEPVGDCEFELEFTIQEPSAPDCDFEIELTEVPPTTTTTTTQYECLLYVELLTTTTTSSTTSSTTTTTTTTQPIENINYGLLYNWWAATDARSITSSDDWVVPSFTQATILQNYYGGQLVAGEFLKEVSLSYWTDIATASNSSGFNGRGSGVRSSDGTSFTEQKNRMWGWLADSSTEVYARNMQLRTAETSFYINENRAKKEGFAIRLLKTSTVLTHGQTGTYTGNDGKIYRTICIGTQEWLADNLAETEYRDTSSIPQVTDSATWGTLITGALCAYNNDWNNV